MKRRRRRRRSGINLIEIMVSLVIMGVIASAVAVGVIRQLRKAREHTTLTRARTIQSAVTGYLAEFGDKCPDVDDLLERELIERTTDHRDAWGRPFTIECEGNTTHVHSMGDDGVRNTEDDIGF